jgi:hypothetical protein
MSGAFARVMDTGPFGEIRKWFLARKARLSIISITNSEIPLFVKEAFLNNY